MREGRNDTIAHILLDRVAKQIIILEGKINEKKREASAELRYPRKFVQYVCKIMHRCRHYKNGSNRSIYQLLTAATARLKAVAR